MELQRPVFTGRMLGCSVDFYKSCVWCSHIYSKFVLTVVLLFQTRSITSLIYNLLEFGTKSFQSWIQRLLCFLILINKSSSSFAEQRWRKLWLKKEKTTILILLECLRAQSSYLYILAPFWSFLTSWL